MGIHISSVNKLVKEGKIVKSIGSNRITAYTLPEYLKHFTTIIPGIYRKGVFVFSIYNNRKETVKQLVLNGFAGYNASDVNEILRISDGGRILKELSKTEEIVSRQCKKIVVYFSKEHFDTQYHQRKELMKLKEKKITLEEFVRICKFDCKDKLLEILNLTKDCKVKRNFESILRLLIRKVFMDNKGFERILIKLEENEKEINQLGANSIDDFPKKSRLYSIIKLIGGKNFELSKELTTEIKKQHEVLQEKEVSIPKHKKNFTKIEDIPKEIKALNNKLAKKELEVNTLKSKLENNGWYLLFSEFVTKCIQIGAINTSECGVDSTYQIGRKDDEDIGLSVKEYKNSNGEFEKAFVINGYKIHILWDMDYTPIEVIVTPANFNDGIVLIPLLKLSSSKINKRIKKLFADATYDSIDNYGYCEDELSCKAYIDVNPRGGGTDVALTKTHYYDEKTGKQRKIHINAVGGRDEYKKRGPGEGINDMIKSHHKLSLWDRTYRKGLHSVLCSILIALLSIVLMLYCATILKRKHLAKSVSRFT